MIWGALSFAAAGTCVLNAACGLWPEAGACLLCLVVCAVIGIADWSRA